MPLDAMRDAMLVVMLDDDPIMIRLCGTGGPWHSKMPSFVEVGAVLPLQCHFCPHDQR